MAVQVAPELQRVSPSALSVTLPALRLEAGDLLRPTTQQFDAEWKFEVFKVRAVKEDKLYALKVLTDSKSGKDELAAKMFFREARILKAMSSSDIVSFHGLVKIPMGTKFLKNKCHLWGLLQQLCEGGPLTEKIFGSYNKSEKDDHVAVVILVVLQSYTASDALRWSTCVANALNFLHCSEPTVLHRDIKVDNILLDYNASTFQLDAKLSDFGLHQLDAKLSDFGLHQVLDERKAPTMLVRRQSSAGTSVASPMPVLRQPSMLGKLHEIGEYEGSEIAKSLELALVGINKKTLQVPSISMSARCSGSSSFSTPKDRPDCGGFTTRCGEPKKEDGDSDPLTRVASSIGTIHLDDTSCDGRRSLPRVRSAIGAISSIRANHVRGASSDSRRSHTTSSSGANLLGYTSGDSRRSAPLKFVSFLELKPNAARAPGSNLHRNTDNNTLPNADMMHNSPFAMQNQPRARKASCKQLQFGLATPPCRASPLSGPMLVRRSISLRNPVIPGESSHGVKAGDQGRPAEDYSTTSCRSSRFSLLRVEACVSGNIMLSGDCALSQYMHHANAEDPCIIMNNSQWEDDPLNEALSPENSQSPFTPTSECSYIPMTSRGRPGNALEALELGNSSHTDKSISSCDSKPDGFISRSMSKAFQSALDQEAAGQLSSLYELDVAVDDGSIFYMAPEVYLRQPYNEKADVFSFGIVMYELFTCTLLAMECITRTGPSNPMSAVQAHAKKVSEGWRPPRLESITDNIWELIQSCWQQNPGARADMATVLEELRRIQAELNIPAPVPCEVVDTIAHEDVEAAACEVVDVTAARKDKAFAKQGCECTIC
eukprot:gene12444-15647_t